MPQVFVPIESAICVRRMRGSNITVINQSAVDVYFDDNPQRLNSSIPGLTPNGTKLAANGGEKEFVNYPGQVWFRSAVATSIEVQP